MSRKWKDYCTGLLIGVVFFSAAALICLSYLFF